MHTVLCLHSGSVTLTCSSTTGGAPRPVRLPVLPSSIRTATTPASCRHEGPRTCKARATAQGPGPDDESESPTDIDQLAQLLAREAARLRLLDPDDAPPPERPPSVEDAAAAASAVRQAAEDNEFQINQGAFGDEVMIVYQALAWWSPCVS